MASPPETLPLPTAGLAGQMSFTFYWASRYPAPPGWTVPPPVQRPYGTLWYVVAGELHVAGRACGPGCLVTWPPGAWRSGENRAGSDALLYTAAFSLRLWGELDFFRLYRVPTVYETAANLEEPFRALVEEMAAHREAVTLVAEGWARVLVGRWLSGLEAGGQLQPAAGVDERLATVLAAVEADLAGEWSLQRLADLMRLSKVRLREVFVAGVGLPPMRYVNLRRLDRARDLLRETDLTSVEVAARCGFPDPAYFSRLFHRLTGMPPVVYRERTRFQEG